MSSLTFSDKIKPRCFHSTKHFIDDLCAINHGGEFGRCISDEYPKEFEFKVERQGGNATFLNLNITTKEGIFIYTFLIKETFFLFSSKNTSYRK